jgi:hypothetical protein
MVAADLKRIADRNSAKLATTTALAGI